MELELAIALKRMYLAFNAITETEIHALNAADAALQAWEEKLDVMPNEIQEAYEAAK